MKPKLRLFQPKKVYYFNHQKGVLQKRSKLFSLRIFATSFMMATILCGLGLGFESYYHAHMSNKSFQQAVAEPDVSQAEAENDKLRAVSTQATEDKALASVISEKLDELPKGQHWSVYVRDLQTNRMASVEADETYDPANLSELFLLPGFENKINASNWTSWNYNYRINNKPAKTCVDLMVRLSDSTCRDAITKYVGLDYADQVNQSLGFSKTRLAGTAPQTTARELGELMYRLQTSHLLSDKARRILFDSLYDQTHTDGIPAGCGPQCLIANKTGETSEMHHDVAVVTSGTGKYVVAIMSSGASWQAVAEVEHAINAAMKP